jgi:hypothetical protein
MAGTPESGRNATTICEAYFLVIEAGKTLYPRKIPLYISTLTMVFTESTFVSIAVTAHSWREDLKCNLFPDARHRLVVQILLAGSFQYSPARAGQLLTRFPSGMACTEAISVFLYGYGMRSDVKFRILRIRLSERNRHLRLNARGQLRLLKRQNIRLHLPWKCQSKVCHALYY